MADIVDVETRSRFMSGIKSVNTKPEMQVRQLLHQAGFRYRLHDRCLPGTPDIWLPRWKAVIEVNGCFWHGHIRHSAPDLGINLPIALTQYLQNDLLVSC